MDNLSEIPDEDYDPYFETQAVLIAPFVLPDDYTVQQLAGYFALQLQCEVQHEQGTVPGEGAARELYKMGNDGGPDYVLVLGESDLSFYKDYVVIQTGGEFEDFCIWKEDFEERGSAVNFYDQYALDDLRSLGIEELYCIRNTLLTNAALSACSAWQAVEAHLLDEEDYFIIPLQENLQDNQ